VQEQNSFSKKLEAVLAPEEKHIVGLKYKSKQFYKMTPSELVTECQILILKISVITGWGIPIDEFQLILTDQFCKKIIESYSTTNVDEIEHAFRNKSIEIKDWGKNFNLSLLDEVLLPYLDKRFNISTVEEKIKTMPIQIIYTDEEIKNQRREEIEKTFQAMKKGYYPILHKYFKEVLLSDELISEEVSIGEFFVRKLNSNTENIYVRSE
jgi:hypothetical protein